MTRFARRTLLAAVAATTAFLSATSAFAYQRWIDIYNDGPCPIYSVQISHVDDEMWGRDLLGRGTIPSGETVRVEPDVNEGYCRFDIRITYEDGSRVVLGAVNLCEATTLVADGSDGWVA